MTDRQPHDVHHLYDVLGGLTPVCKHWPGQDDAGDWHTSHDARVLIEYAEKGAFCCTVCLNAARARVEYVGGDQT